MQIIELLCSSLGGNTGGPMEKPGIGALWRSLVWIASNFEQIACAGLLAVMVGSITAAVIFRYLLNSPLPWPEELSLFALVWMTFIGASLVTKRREHIIIDSIPLLLPSRARLWMTLVVHLSLIAFLILFLFVGVQIMRNMWGMATSPALSINMGLVYLSVPLGTALMIVHLAREIAATIKELRAIKGK